MAAPFATAARNASMSSEKSFAQRMPTKRSRKNSACIENIANEGAGAITTAPSRATAAVMYWIHSSNRCRAARRSLWNLHHFPDQRAKFICRGTG